MSWQDVVSNRLEIIREENDGLMDYTYNRSTGEITVKYFPNRDHNSNSQAQYTDFFWIEQPSVHINWVVMHAFKDFTPFLEQKSFYYNDENKVLNILRTAYNTCKNAIPQIGHDKLFTKNNLWSTIDKLVTVMEKTLN